MSDKAYIIYAITTGAIKRTGTAPESMLLIQAQPGERVKEGAADQLTQYVIVDPLDAANDVLADKQPMTPTISASTVAEDTGVWTASDLPVPVQYTISGPITAAGEETDGDLSLTFALPGQYEITFRSVKHLDYVTSVTVT